MKAEIRFSPAGPCVRITNMVTGDFVDVQLVGYLEAEALLRNPDECRRLYHEHAA